MSQDISLLEAALAKEKSRRQEVEQQLAATFERIQTLEHQLDTTSKTRDPDFFLKYLIFGLNSAILLEDEHRRIIIANPAFCRTFQIDMSPEELAGKDAIEELKRFKHLMQDPDGCWAKMALRVSEQRSASDEVVMVNGTVFERDYIPIFQENKYMGHLWSYKNITGHKQIEKDLKDVNAKTLQSVKDKETFMATMSHEIRTPMNVIIGLTRLLERTDLDKTQANYLYSLKKSSENLLVLINDLLDFSKIESDKLILESIHFSLSEVFTLVIQAVKFKALEKHLNLTWSIDERVYDILKGDHFRLNQILLNLLNNAVKFTERGSVSLTCDLVSHTADKQVLRFKVSDTGIGITPDKLETIFESFTQEDSSISRKYGGTGLGLAICKKLVHKFGGDIKIQSEKGVGTSFEFDICFEIGSEDMYKEKLEVSNINYSIKGTYVLLVEDNEMNQLLARTILQEWGCTVDVAENGLESIAKIEAQHYDIVLMDMQMPVMGGIEATKIIREKLKSQVPIIALTANAVKKDEESCLEAGMNDYISKPFEEEDLYQKVVKYLNMPEYKKPAQGTAGDETTAVTELYNLSKLEVLSRGNQEFVKKMVRLFVETTPSNIVKLKAAINDSDFAQVKAIAHTMKPSIDLLNIKSLHVTVREIEDNAQKKQNHVVLSELIRNLCKILEEVIAELQVKEL